jgi:hypothetical protein
MKILFTVLPAPPHCLSHLTGNHLLHFYNIESNDITHKRFNIARILLDKVLSESCSEAGKGGRTQISSA